MIGGSLARSWPPPLPRYRRYCVLPLLLLLGLSAAAANNICAVVLASAVLLCACSRTSGASSRELGERHASCDILLSLLLQLRGGCGCCECSYVLPPPPLLPPPPPLLLLLLSVVMDFWKSISRRRQIITTK